MRKWIWGVVVGFFLAFFLLFAIGWFGLYLQQRPPAVASNTTLILDLEGDIPEQVPPDLAGQLLGEPEQITMTALLQHIEKATADSRITGIVLKASNLGIGWGKLQ